MAVIVFLDGLVDKELLEKLILPWLLQEGKQSVSSERLEKELPVSGLKLETQQHLVVDAVLSGQAVLIVQQLKPYFLISIPKWTQRNPDAPAIESTVKGTREGFVETLSVNLSLVRRYLKDPRLTVEQISVGSLSQTKVAILYVREIVNPEVLDEVRQRLGRIETDTILASSQIEQWIEDNGWSIFPTIQVTERPDVTAASLAEGKVAVFTDNSPFALLVPFTFIERLQNMDDYYEKWQVAMLIRFVRLVAFALSLFVPGLYVALIHYNAALIPTDLLISIMNSHAQIPFPVIWELLLMELTIEIFREAGIRLPKPLGQTVGIVGGIVIGEAAVQASLVSPITLIVVALTAMASFSAPNYSLAYSFRLLRFMFIGLSAVLGLYGFVFGVTIILIHLSSLNSFGVSYLAPFAPLRLRDWVDQLMLWPARWRNFRPAYLTTRSRKGDWKPLKRG